MTPAEIKTPEDFNTPGHLLWRLEHQHIYQPRGLGLAAWGALPIETRQQYEACARDLIRAAVEAAVVQEREACARMADGFAGHERMPHDTGRKDCLAIAKYIRARGGK